MNFQTNLSDYSAKFDNGKHAQMMFDNIARLTERLKGELPAQRELVDKVYQYGFQSI